MKNFYKHLLMLGLFLHVSIGASATVYSGSCGSNAKWSLDTSTGLLSITGSGDMADYSFGSAPWYSYRSSIKSLSIGDQITSIGDYAFNYCSSLTSVTIPNSVTSIGRSAFAYCSGLTSVTIPNSVTSIGRYAFERCSGLTSVTIPNSVTSIDDDAFYYCSGLTSVTIPNSVTSIGSHAFAECSSLTSVTIPNSVTSIGSHAFGWCSGLTSVTIPNSVTSIGENPFGNCSGLTSIVVESGNKVYDSRVNCNAIIETASNTLISGCKNTTIPNSVTSIGNYAFLGCSGLTSVTIPNSVTEIGASTFNGCSGLTSVTIPNSVTSIGDNAFYRCKGLTSVTIGNSVTSIGDYAFSECSGLTSVTIPNSVTKIGSAAFGGCSGLTSVTIPNSVTSIGVNPFGNCSGLTSIVVESGNKVYDSRGNCNAIIETASNTLVTGCKNTTIPNSVTKIGSAAFGGCSGLISVTIPNSVTEIGESAFYGCSGLTSVTIPNSVTSIGDYAFAFSGLTNVTIPNPVTKIGYSAFQYCSRLTNVTIGNSVTSIGSSAFRNCSGLTSITVEAVTPPSIQKDTFDNFEKPTLYVPGSALGAYKAHQYWGQFKNIQAIQGADIPNNEIWYTSSNGKVVTPYKSNVFGANIVSNTYTNGKGIIKFDGNVTSIGNYAFYNCYNLTSVKIPNSVTEIGNSAFYRCSGLTSVTIGNSVTSIGEWAFYDCSGLTSVTIPNSVTEIGNSAFYSCSGLTSVTIPNSVTSIGNRAFSSCSGLTSIAVESGNKVYDSRGNCNAIIETARNTLISGCKNTIIPNSVTSIGAGAFYGCSGLTSVTIPNSVTSIGDHAFYRCKGLTSVTIGNFVTSIGEWTFGECSSLTSVTIPNSVTSIGSSAFGWCSGLTSVTIPNSVTSIGSGAFHCCSGLTSMIVESGNKVFDSRNNCNAIIETKSNTLISGCKNTIIPNSVTSIGLWAFYGCSGLTSVTIPNSVTSIGDGAFDGCEGLTSVTIPNSVTSIGDYAFAFSGLTNVTIGNSVTSIGSYAFSGCSGLASITVEAITPPSIQKDTFDNFEKPTLYVPGSALGAYKAHQYWGQFKNIQAISMSYTKEDLDAIRAQWEAAAMNMQAIIQELGNAITYYNYIKKYLLLFANDEQKAELAKLDAVLAAVPAELAEMEQGIKYYLESYLARLYNCTTDAEVEQLVAECNKMLDSYYSSLNIIQAKFLSVEEELNALYKANVQLILSAALAAKTDLASQLSAAGADCRTLQKLFETLKALCGTKAGMIDPSILSNETVVKFEKDLNSLLRSMESCESDYDKNVSKVVPTSVETGVALARSMSRIYNNLLDIEKKCEDLKMKYEEVERIVKSGKIVPGGTAHSWRVSDRTDIAVDFASINAADASSLVADGDTLYLERGTNLTAEQTFKKRLVIVGPGYKYDKTGQDACVRNLYAYGEGAEIIGVNVTGYLYAYANNLTISHCRLKGVIGYKTSYENANCKIHSCFIDGNIHGDGEDNSDAWVLTNNIFAEGYIINLDNAVLDHNTFVVSNADFCLNGVTNSVVKNNILFHKRGNNPLLNCTGNTYEKNIFSMDQKLDNNKWNETLEKIISCTGDPSQEAYYQTGNNSVAYHYSTDGSDCGAFGGKEPYVMHGYTDLYVESEGGGGGDDPGFQIEPNDLLALKNLYNRYGGSKWYSGWTFKDKGVEAEDFPGVVFTTNTDSYGYHYVQEINLSKNNLSGDVSSWALSFPRLTSLNLSSNNLTGDLTGFVAELSNLKTLNVGYNMLTGLTSLPKSVATLYKDHQMANQYNTEYYANLTPVQVLISDEAVKTVLPTIFTYNLKSNSTEPVATEMLYEAGNSGNFGRIEPTGNGYKTTWTSIPYFYEEEQDRSICLRSNDGSLYPAILSYVNGDADMSGFTNVLDVQNTINYILNPALLERFNSSAANTYSDKMVNVQDIVCTVNIILGLPNSPSARMKMSGYDLSSTANSLYTQGERVWLNVDSETAALDVVLKGVSTDEVSLMLNHNDFQMIARNTEEGSRYVIYSLTGKTIPVGTTAILRTSCDEAEPTDALLSTIDAKSIPVAVGMSPTGIAKVNTDNAIVRIYTIKGMEVYNNPVAISDSQLNEVKKNLANGIYIVDKQMKNGSHKKYKYLKQ